MASSSMLAADLASSQEQVRPILLGSKMPDVPLRTVAGKPTTLKAQVGGKPAILVFYRGGWCPFCNLQLSNLRLIQKDVEAMGYRIIAISPDRPEELAKTMGKD
ncbi:MAG: redoxin domain-containing protein, partial [Thermomonas sp.]